MSSASINGVPADPWRIYKTRVFEEHTLTLFWQPKLGRKVQLFLYCHFTTSILSLYHPIGWWKPNNCDPFSFISYDPSTDCCSWSLNAHSTRTASRLQQYWSTYNVDVLANVEMYGPPPSILDESNDPQKPHNNCRYGNFPQRVWHAGKAKYASFCHFVLWLTRAACFLAGASNQINTWTRRRSNAGENISVKMCITFVHWHLVPWLL